LELLHPKLLVIRQRDQLVERLFTSFAPRFGQFDLPLEHALLCFRSAISSLGLCTGRFT
jgi:hypothetical protein